jgi:diguanylate cyclase (GGDEF)-like protein/PAS domain S-box-containing protein
VRLGPVHGTRRAAVGPLALVGLVTLVAVLALSYLLRSTTDHHRQALAARSAQDAVARVDATEWRARALGTTTTEIRQSMSRELAQAHAFIAQSSPRGQVSTAADEALFATYRTAITREIDLLESHDLVRATAVDDAEVDPAFQALDSTLDATAKRSTATAAEALEELKIGTLIVLSAAAALIALIFWRTTRRRVNVVALKQRAQATKESEERFRSLVQNTADGILLVGPDGVVLFATSPVATMLDTAEADVVGRGLAELTNGAPGPSSVVSRAQVEGSRIAMAEWHLTTADGRERILEIIANAGYDGGPHEAVLLTVRDMTDHKLLERLLNHRASHDPLTGLANREELVQAIEAATTRPGGPAGTLVFIDLDDFKNVNDTLGHIVGDDLLRAVADRLRRAVGPTGLAARLGGDEFGALLTDVTDVGAALASAKEMLASFAEPFVVDGVSLRQDASLGVAVIDASEPPGVSDLLRAADIAMYDAKLAGKNRIALFSPEMQDNVNTSVRFRNDLAQAVRDGDLEVAYQPIVGLTQGSGVIGLEALARWNHPTEGSIPPVRFIPVAEQSDLICDIGRFVLTAACRAAASWRVALGHDYPVSVNVSARHFDADLVGDVKAALATADLPARLLKIEITESVLRGRERAAVTLRRLRTLGVRVSLDDFGTEYSALSYVRDFPLDELKIDRSFIRDLDSDSGVQFVRTIIHLAETLKIVTVAEGIETAEQANTLRREGCSFGQGFLYARPMSADQVQVHLRQARTENAKTAKPARRSPRVRPALGT